MIDATEPPDGMDPETWERFLNMPIKLWFCPRRPEGIGVDPNHMVTWEGQQARCKCGETRLPDK